MTRASPEVANALDFTIPSGVHAIADEAIERTSRNAPRSPT